MASFFFVWLDSQRIVTAVLMLGLQQPVTGCGPALSIADVCASQGNSTIAALRRSSRSTAQNSQSFTKQPASYNTLGIPSQSMLFMITYDDESPSEASSE